MRFQVQQHYQTKYCQVGLSTGSVNQQEVPCTFKTIQLDFATIMRCEIRELRELNSRDFTLRMREVMSPLEQIARGMGFTPGWKYE